MKKFHSSHVLKVSNLDASYSQIPSFASTFNMLSNVVISMQILMDGLNDDPLPKTLGMTKTHTCKIIIAFLSSFMEHVQNVRFKIGSPPSG